MMLMTMNRTMMQGRPSGLFTNALGWPTTGATFADTGCLVISWL
jgi:hypothetical protein